VLALALASCTDDGGSVAALCDTLASQDHASTFAGFDPTDPEGALERFRTARVALGDLLDDAPTEIRDEIQIEIDYLQALVDALEDVPPGDATDTALRIQAVTDTHPDVERAAADLEAFTAEEC
jgi:hypothetical protein